MLVLYETPDVAGFALFHVKKESKLADPEQLYAQFESLEKAKKLVRLRDFQKFTDTADALASTTAVIEGKLSDSLADFLDRSVLQKELRERLAVQDRKLGQAIKERFPDLDPVSDTSALELFRCIRFQVNDLLNLDGVTADDMSQMQLGLAHSLGRYKLKFSPDKVDVMIVQAISLLDDLDKEINTYAMRVKEWYGWHFPELVRIVTDNLVYARLVLHVGLRKNAETLDLSDVLEEPTAQVVAKAASTSMGTDISEADVSHIKALCVQVIEICEYREELYEYIKNRMRAIAPNLTILVGELVGARLIAHAGSLLNLAKQPASTVQILGAEKALFRALKTKKATPKYGLIYHASLVGQSQTKSKGKVSRVLANKAALSIRVDALGDEDTKQIGIECLEAVSSRIQQLDGRRPVIAKPEPAKLDKYVKSAGAGGGYNPAEDVVMTDANEESESDEKPKKKDKKKKSKKDKGDKKKKSKKRAREDSSDDNNEEKPKKKAKKSKKAKKVESSSSSSESSSSD